MPIWAWVQDRYTLVYDLYTGVGGIWAVYDGIRMVSGCINAGGNRWYRVVYGWYAGGIRVVYGWFTELDTKYEPETLVALERHQAVMDR